MSNIMRFLPLTFIILPYYKHEERKDYENFETVSYEIEGVTFYCPVSGDQVGYQAFPSSPVKAGIRFLGSGIADGFAPVQDTDTAVVGGP